MRDILERGQVLGDPAAAVVDRVLTGLTVACLVAIGWLAVLL